MTWIPVGNRPPRDLANARVVLHHAIQLPAVAIGKALVPTRADDSHTAVTWRPDAKQWVTEAIPASQDLRSGLRPAELTLTLGRDGALAARSLPLGGITRERAIEWLRDGIRGEGLDADAVHFAPHYDLPPHPVADQGLPFDDDLAPDLAELAAYFANAHSLLTTVASEDDGAGTILTWPHHFDIGGLLPMGPPEDRFVRSVGIGLSAGDASYSEPYFYVGVYPAPADAKLPPLPIGHWHTEGFLAAALTATELIDLPSGNSQHDRALLFLESAVAAARALLA